MPDREGAIISDCVKQELTIRADSRMTDGCGRGQRIRLSPDHACRLVERDAYKPILQLFDVHWKADAVGNTVIDVSAVWRESGECLEFRAVTQ